MRGHLYRLPLPVPAEACSVPRPRWCACRYTSARELGHFPDRVDAFIGVLGILAIKAMKSSPEDINDLLRELGRLAK